MYHWHSFNKSINIVYIRLASSSPRSKSSFTLIWQVLHQDQQRQSTTSSTPSTTFTTPSHHHIWINFHTRPQCHKCTTSSLHRYYSGHLEGPAPHRPRFQLESQLGNRHLVSFVLFATNSRSYPAVMAHTHPAALGCIQWFSVLTKDHANRSHRGGVFTYSSMAPSNIFWIPRAKSMSMKWFQFPVSTFFSLLLWKLDLDLY